MCTNSNTVRSNTNTVIVQNIYYIINNITIVQLNNRPKGQDTLAIFLLSHSGESDVMSARLKHNDSNTLSQSTIHKVLLLNIQPNYLQIECRTMSKTWHQNTAPNELKWLKRRSWRNHKTTQKNTKTNSLIEFKICVNTATGVQSLTH